MPYKEHLMLEYLDGEIMHLQNPPMMLYFDDGVSPRVKCFNVH